MVLPAPPSSVATVSDLDSTGDAMGMMAPNNERRRLAPVEDADRRVKFGAGSSRANSRQGSRSGGKVGKSSGRAAGSSGCNAGSSALALDANSAFKADRKNGASCGSVKNTKAKPTLKTQTKFKEPKPMLKTWEFYNRRGFLWSSPYHVPDHKQRELARPDLDHKHAKYVAKCEEEDRMAAEAVMRARKRNIKKIRTRLHMQQITNAEKAAAYEGYSQHSIEGGDNQEKSHKQVNRLSKRKIKMLKCAMRAASKRNQHHLKDSNFYSGRGNLWEQMCRVPPERFAFVINEKILQGDWWALSQLEKRLNDEATAEVAFKKERRLRHEAIMTGFKMQQHKNNAKWVAIGIAPRTSKREPIHRDNDKVKWTRTETLAAHKTNTQHALRSPITRPRTANAAGGASSFGDAALPISPTIDHKGLLHMDEVMMTSMFNMKKTSGKPRVQTSAVFFTSQRENLLLSPMATNEVFSATAPLSAPDVVLNELDTFEDQLQYFEERGETRAPFYLPLYVRPSI